MPAIHPGWATDAVTSPRVRTAIVLGEGTVCVGRPAGARRGGHHVSMTDFLAGYVVPPGAGLADDPGLKASQHSTGGALSVFETTVGAGPPLHVHDREDECFYVLD